MSVRTCICSVIAIVFSSVVFFTPATFADAGASSDEGVPVGIGVTASSGGIVPMALTYVNVLLKKADGKLELLPMSLKTNDCELAVRAIALIQGAIRMEKPLKVSYETTPDGDQRICSMESAGIVIRFP